MFKVEGAVGVNMTLITLLSCSSLSAQFLAAAGPTEQTLAAVRLVATQ